MLRIKTTLYSKNNIQEIIFLQNITAMKQKVTYPLMDDEYKMRTITEIVSDVMKIPIEDFIVSTKQVSARDQNKVAARQLSMFFTRSYTGLSLAKIGQFHLDRDHATVLHACKTINGYIDSKDKVISLKYATIDINIQKWLRRISHTRNKSSVKKTYGKDLPLCTKLLIVKECIKNHVSFEDRERILDDKNEVYLYYKNNCSNGNKSKAVSGKLQSGHKRSLQQRCN